MSAVLTALSLYAAACLLVTAAGAVLVAADRGFPPRPNKPGLSWFLREWAATMLVVALLPLGRLIVGPRRFFGPEPGDGVTRLPVIIVPGFHMNASGSQFLATYLRRRGWAWVWPINNVPFSAPIEVHARHLHERVEELCHASGADQVDLVGHSMGGVIGAYYLNVMGGDRRVRRLVTLGTPWRGTATWVFGLLRQARDLAPDAPVIERIQAPVVPTTAIWSRWDALVIPANRSTSDGMETIEVSHLGHLEMLVSGRVFRLVAATLAASDSTSDDAASHPPEGEE